MKNLTTILFFLLLLNFHPSFAQTNCPEPDAHEVIENENYKALISNGGYLFRDGDSNFGQFQIPYTDDNSPSSIFAAGLWMGAYTGLPDNPTLRVAVVDYPSGVQQYLAGPLNDVGVPVTSSSCEDFNKIWTVTGDEIEAHIQDFANNGVIDSPIPSIMGYPGKENPHFAAENGFELPYNDGQHYGSFVDEFTGVIDVYNPSEGDYPTIFRNDDIIPNQLSYSVFNTVVDNGFGAALRMEVHLTTWSASCPELSVLDETIFTNYRFFYKGVEILDSIHTSIWVDFDLGCFEDDFIGCDPGLGTFYVYNQNDIDNGNGACDASIPTYGENPPVQAVTFLGRYDTDTIFDYFTAYGGNNSPPEMSAPTTPQEYFNYMSGSWKDGTPLTFGGDGYDPNSNEKTNFIFPGDPNDASEWSLESENISDNYRVIGTANYKNVLGETSILPYTSFEYTLAWSFHRGEGNNRLENIALMKDEIQKLREWYFNAFPATTNYSPPCDVFSSTIDNQLVEDKIILFPNPNNGVFQLDFSDLEIENIQVFDLSGKLMLEKNGKFRDSLEIQIPDERVGVYFLKGTVDGQNFYKKLVVN